MEAAFYILNNNNKTTTTKKLGIRGIGNRHGGGAASTEPLDERVVLWAQRDRVQNDGDESENEDEQGEGEEELPSVQLVDAGHGALEARVELVLDRGVARALERVRTERCVDEVGRAVELVVVDVAQKRWVVVPGEETSEDLIVQVEVGVLLNLVFV